MSFNFDNIQGENQPKASTDRDGPFKIYSHSVLSKQTKIDYHRKTISEPDHTDTMTNTLL